MHSRGRIDDVVGDHLVRVAARSASRPAARRAPRCVRRRPATHIHL